MQKITFSDFSGGIQEATGPDDFTSRQWAKLKGIVPTSDRQFETQWAAHVVGTSDTGNTGFGSVFPISTSAGTYLVGIKADGETGEGTIWWCSAPSSNAAYTANRTATWYQLTTAQNYGFGPTSSAQPSISIQADDKYRFVCGVSIPLADYVTTPGSPANIFHYDTPSAYGVAQGVLVHSRYDTGTNQQAMVCYVDTASNSVKAIVFPAFRRFYDFDLHSAATDATWDDTTDGLAENWKIAPVKSGDGIWVKTTKVSIASNYATLTLKRFFTSSTSGVKIFAVGDWITISGVHEDVDGTRQITSVGTGASAATKTITFAVPAENLTAINAVGTVRELNQLFTMTQYPASGSNPNSSYYHQPYYYQDATGATLPGRGIIPRANVGAMWRETLILGDIQWRKSVASEIDYYPSDTTANFPISDTTVGEYPNYMYVSAGEVDQFYPFGVLEATATGAKILGMHVVRDTLVVIPSYGGPLDGVVGIRGNLGEVLTTTFNPLSSSFRKELLRGGVGGVPDSGTAPRSFSCLWPELGIACFVDINGGVWYTNGSACDRIDRFGPISPTRSTVYDHVAAVGKHLFVWRDSRLLLFSVMEGNESAASGCWTELVTPSVTSGGSISSMAGTQTELYFVHTSSSGDRKVMRYSLACNVSERGYVDEGGTFAQVDLTVGTRTVSAGEEGEAGYSHRRQNWHRFGISFETKASCSIRSIQVQASGVLNVKGSTPKYTLSSAPDYPRSFDSATDELHEFIVPAGIGSQSEASATVVLRGHVLMQSAAFWVTGSSPKRANT